MKSVQKQADLSARMNDLKKLYVTVKGRLTESDQIKENMEQARPASES